MLVDFIYYGDVFEGTEIESADFDKLSKQAEKDVYSFIQYAMDDLSKLDENKLIHVKKAICLQAEFLNVNGVNNRLNAGGGFSVGSFSKSEQTSKTSTDNYHPDLKMVLFPTGLLYRGVSVW
ncbi:MAG: hypothetical protein L0J63_01180 [Tetragenococcus koreensis]|nr:hypothetical protein [Tetragenococcus koreensis]